MAQHDYVIANGTGAAVRSDLNNALAAIVSQNSGATAPATTYAYQFWADTTTNLLKLRNSANSAWITLFQLDGEWSTLPVENGTAAAPSIYFKDSGTDTGFYSPGTDQVAISTGGTGRLFINSSGSVGIGTSSPLKKTEIRSTPSTADTDGLRVGDGTRYLEFAQTGATYNYMQVGANQNLIYFSGSNLSLSTDGANAITLNTNSLERVRVTSAGNVGIGSTPSFRLDVNTGSNDRVRIVDSASATLELERTGAKSYLIQSTGDSGLRVYDEDAGSERLRIDSSGRLGLGISSPVNSFSIGEIGSIDTDANSVYIGNNFTGSGVNFRKTGNYAQRLMFDTATGNLTFSNTASTGTAGNAISFAERLRIDKDGNAFIKVMQVGGTANMHWSSTVGQLFVTSSSLRFKKDIVDYDKGLAEVMQMQPKYFVYNQEPGGKRRAGFIAEDFHDLGLNEYVEYWKGEEGEDLPSEIGYSNMVAILVKAIQELKAEVDDLKSQLA